MASFTEGVAHLILDSTESTEVTAQFESKSGNCLYPQTKLKVSLLVHVQMDNLINSPSGLECYNQEIKGKGSPLEMNIDLPFQSKLIPIRHLLGLFDLAIYTRCLPTIEAELSQNI